MTYMAYIGFTGILLMAGYGVLASFKVRSASYQLFLQGLWALALLMTSLFPLALILKERPAISSLFFWVSSFTGIGLISWGAFEGCCLLYDLWHGSRRQAFHVIAARRVERSLRHGGDYYLIESARGMSFEVDDYTYQAIQRALGQTPSLPILLDYYPKTKIIVEVIMD
ncbi:MULTISPECIES: hypothetical protein [Aerococcus]|uniref:Uncharacterized protein n=1 Tax=Aerococcus tenax TaxID=3078812 RepID=A0A5N1BNN6_9LACT|nr:hypothetical protein [Aerococcus urinae]KAA9241010.1 hypothetical protein F6I34_03580 [Aerococcus urinae]MDK6370485.1 hypothetical protein [Aerococcus urinae]MDK6596843.1 hypothetical protein [Aerococcus urinae]MDK7302306.1 hypothetical protein [Aerococcus urinae]MDK7800741.1 hypothetical protein [Aerococcus urinae]